MSSVRGHLSRSRKEVRKQVTWVFGRRAFQAENGKCKGSEAESTGLSAGVKGTVGENKGPDRPGPCKPLR